MSQVISWEDAPSGASGKRKKGGNFLKLTHGQTYTVRLVGKPVQFFKYFRKDSGKFYSAITDASDDCIIKNDYNLTPNERYAINVIDRDDDGIKIMEMPRTLFGEIQSWASARKKDPGKDDSVDFHIKVTRSDPSDPRTTRYSLVALDPAPFTDAEKERIKNKELHDLLSVFKATPQDEIEVKMGFKEESASSSSENSSAQSSSDDEDGDDLPF